MQIDHNPFKALGASGQTAPASAQAGSRRFDQGPGVAPQAYAIQQQAQLALNATQSLSVFYLSIVGVAAGPGAGGGQATSLQLLIQQAGSPQLKTLLSQQSMTEDEMVRYLIENPDQLEGLRGQGLSLSLAANLSAAAPSDSSSAALAGELESGGDGDLTEFTQDETMAAPSMCAMGGVSSADKAKPEMQQNLKEVKAISAAISEMMSGEDGSDNWLAMVSLQLRGKEQIIRSCLRRGKGAADESYRSQGVDPKDDGAVSAFVAQIGKEVITLAVNCGLDIEVSEKRAARLDNRPGRAEKGGRSQAAGATADKDEPFEIRTQKTDKHIELGVDEVEANPAMAGAILEQLLAMWQMREADAANYKAPKLLDLGETRQGSPLDQAFGGSRATPVPSPSGSASISQGRPRAAVGAPGAVAGLRGLMALLGITGQKFSTKIRVYEPNARVVLERPGQGGVRVNGGLKGKSISVRTPKMVARAADGTLHRIQGVRRVASSGSFMAVVKGEATGAEAAKQLFTRGDGSISIPGTKAN